MQNCFVKNSYYIEICLLYYVLFIRRACLEIEKDIKVNKRELTGT